MSLGIGTILATFQLSGRQPDVTLRLNSFVKLGAILSAVAFSILAEIDMLGPLNLDIVYICVVGIGELCLKSVLLCYAGNASKTLLLCS